MYEVAESIEPDSYFALARATFARDGPRRDHGRRGVPLPPSRPRRRPLRGPERDGEGGDRSGPRGGNPHHPARHLLPPRRDRARGGGRPAALLGRHRRRLGRAGRGARGVADGQSRSGDPQRSRGRPGVRGPGGGVRRERSWPLHAHVSEQPAENDDCLAAYGKTPTTMLADADALSERFTAVHATHLDENDFAAARRRSVRDLSLPDDGARPRRRRRAGASPGPGGRTALPGHRFPRPDRHLRGSARVELDERLESGIRGGHSAAELLRRGNRGRPPRASAGPRPAGSARPRSPTW